jgi:hypothetical protein
MADAAQRRRRNLLRKELAWLRRGPPARRAGAQLREVRAEKAGLEQRWLAAAEKLSG